MCVCEREIREGVGEWRWWDERGREKRKLCKSRNHEKQEGEIIGEISEDNEEGGEIIWGLGLVWKRFKR